MKKLLSVLLAVIAACFLSAAFFAGCAPPEETKNVTFKTLTADGGPKQTTKQLTLLFDAPVDGLAPADITLSGVAGAAPQTVSAGSSNSNGTRYTVGISGFTESGTLYVSVKKGGYNISGSLDVEIYYFAPVQPLAVENPVIDKVSWASGTPAADADGYFAFSEPNGTKVDVAITYRFPVTNAGAAIDVMAVYSTVKIYYTVARVDPEDTKPMKVTIKQGYNSSTNLSAGEQYPERSNEGDGTWTYSLDDSFDTRKDGFTIQYNNYRDPATDPNPSAEFKLKITKIEFTND